MSGICDRTAHLPFHLATVGGCDGDRRAASCRRTAGDGGAVQGQVQRGSVASGLAPAVLIGLDADRSVGGDLYIREGCRGGGVGGVEHRVRAVRSEFCVGHRERGLGGCGVLVVCVSAEGLVEHHGLLAAGSDRGVAQGGGVLAFHYDHLGIFRLPRDPTGRDLAGGVQEGGAIALGVQLVGPGDRDGSVAAVGGQSGGVRSARVDGNVLAGEGALVGGVQATRGVRVGLDGGLPHRGAGAASGHDTVRTGRLGGDGRVLNRHVGSLTGHQHRGIESIEVRLLLVGGIPGFGDLCVPDGQAATVDHQEDGLVGGGGGVGSAVDHRVDAVNDVGPGQGGGLAIDGHAYLAGGQLSVRVGCGTRRRGGPDAGVGCGPHGDGRDIRG